MSVFKKGNMICYVVQDEGESYEHFLDRGNFIVSQRPNNDQEYQKAVTYSRFYINCKVLRCSYPEAIMNTLKEMTKKCTNQ
ncbi:XRN2-binding (XTBD) domain-containing protein [Fadolivirus algeromassiliense]|jgi:hypothetical protein|uniref:XRN2-binding (XTBD) domain-containing protein n=1 Tax=Fadolivirus FV1/VV64 TaxID=3070911 RepID=A0A7D3UT35_9VIRU|nr:XRN2-binding (XTBD) domain-containing protein [Fadolivirus algeromassiliense]QKF94010.1 XRN2-binding (XTBD) domain-containing protein [Fadolivirus FV1/VV64]